MKRFVQSYSLCSLGRCSEQESFSRHCRWLMGLQLTREKVVHLVCSRSCPGFMCLWESAEQPAAAWKMCTAATSAPSETPGQGTAKIWRRIPALQIHGMRTEAEVWKCISWGLIEWVIDSEQWDLTGLSEERPRGAPQRKNTIATVQFLVSLLLELHPSLETMTCKRLQNINYIRNSYLGIL